MATVRESDTSLWLHNKLGDNEDLWSGISSISTQLKGDVLQNIHACFQGLHPTVKLKMLMSILHMPRRNADEFQKELSSILHQALTDSDQWVSTIATILLPYPSTGRLNMDIEHSHPFLADILKDLRKTLRETDSNTLLPLECQYLNKNALTQLVGMQAPLVKHFALKRKPKSAALRAELLQKSTEAALNKKQSVPSTVPTKSRSMVRKISDDGPLRGIPKATPGFRPAPSSVNRSMPLNRNAARITVNREGGTKMLDITEQPIGGGSREAKRRKKQAELEAQEQAKKEKDAAQAATPDYAASLMSPAVAQAPAAATTTVPTEPVEPSYAPSVTIATPAAPAPMLSNIAQQPVVNPSPATMAARENLQQQLQQSLQQTLQSQFTQPNPPTQQQPPTPTPTVVTTPTLPQPSLQPPPPYPQPTVPGLMSSIPGFLNTIAPSGARPNVGVTVTPSANVVTAGGNAVVANQVAAGAGAAAGGTAPKKGLSLTREQMLAAQEMFRQSNKVTRPEKALILGFMAGARENPCPQQGNIVTIRLSENSEVVDKGEGNVEEMLVDTYFEMNYATGEWRRYKKYKPM
ncbi:negative elongation factor A-like [Amphiura filiformis]|uniref:negative elongation factor A-like n=1 Tax=Amphiura filiformis TaxID=82378 RepID=UPI003B21FD56